MRGGRADAGTKGGAYERRSEKRPAGQGSHGQTGAGADGTSGHGALTPSIATGRQGQGKRHQQYAQDLGVHAYMNKPVSLQRLVETIVKLLEERSSTAPAGKPGKRASSSGSAGTGAAAPSGP